MDVNIDFFIEIFRQAIALRSCPNIGKRRLDGFLHDVTEFTGHDHPSRSFHNAGFDGQQFSADFRPGQTDGETDLILAFRFTMSEFRHAQILRNGVCCNGNFFRCLRLDKFFGNFATDGGYFSLQIPNTRFPRVLSNNPQQGASRKFDIFVLQPVGFHFLGDKIFFCDLQFFLFRVSGNADHFHSVLKRRRNSLQNVGRCNEHDVGQIVVQVQIIVIEGDVLFGIKNL